MVDPGGENATLNHIRLYAIANPLAGPDNPNDPTDPDGLKLVFFELPVPAYEALLLPSGRPVGVDAAVPSGDTVGTMDARISNAVWRAVVEPGGGPGPEGMLYATHQVNLPVQVVTDWQTGATETVDRAGVRWYRIRTNGWPLSGELPELADSGEVVLPNAVIDEDGDGTPDFEAPVHLFMPSVSVNSFGDMALVVHRSSLAHRFGTIAAGRFADSAPGEVFEKVLVLATSQIDGPPTPRAGDYTDLAPDPVDGETWWAIGEYMRSSCEPTCPGGGAGLADPCWATRAARIELELIAP